jgi:hypothetical protein
MRRIDPTTIYETKELKQLLKDIVKISTLRQFGLVGSPGSGYWGQNVVDSLNNYWDHLVSRRTGKVDPKERHFDEKPEIFENRTNKIQNRQVHPTSRSTHEVESQWERFDRKLSQN